ncbi:hypothetical protein [Nesterenkonia sp. NBAIMH1]|uniref:hypothetical protein n=1 Tax=Nesterenkonia sp. NBAIMH1 TaxID=2600320 RepID=UPI0011B3C061|nr:hypothetical protein [Nesterenkonia sp. NBAIMH1]
MVIPGDEGCFPVDPEGHLLADTPEGLVLGAPDAFANRQIERAGNAALALSLAQDLSGEDDQLIWYTPPRTTAPPGGGLADPGQLLDDGCCR